MKAREGVIYMKRFWTSIDASEGEKCDICGNLLRARIDYLFTEDVDCDSYQLCQSCADISMSRS